MIAKELARELVTAQAFLVIDPGAPDHGRRLHHCRMSISGADWDESAVLDLIDTADDIDWEDSFLFGRGMAVYAEGRRYFFDTIRPPT